IVVVVAVVTATRTALRNRRWELLTGAAFATAAVSSTIPRPDAIHFGTTVPLAAAAMVVVCAHTAVRARSRRALATALAGVAGLGIFAVGVPAAAGLAGRHGTGAPGSVFASVPEDRVERREVAAVHGRPLLQTARTVFVVRQDAAFW